MCKNFLGVQAFALTGNGHWISPTTALLQYTGYDRSELLSCYPGGFMDLLPAVDRKSLLALCRTKKEDVQQSYPCQIRTKSGEYRPLQCVFCLPDLPDQALVYCSLFFSGQVEESWHRRALCQTEVIPWLYDFAWDNLQFDLEEKWESIVSLPDSCTQNPSIADEISIKIRDVCDKSSKNAPSGTVTFQARLPKDVCWIALTYETHFDSKDRPIYTIGTFRDVTAQQLQSLQYEQEKRYRLSLSANAISVYEVNLSRDLLIGAHSDWLPLLKLPKAAHYSQLVHQALLQTVIPTDRVSVMRTISQSDLLDAYRSGKRRVECEYLRVYPNRELRWARCCTYLIESAHSADICALICIQDIDQQKKKELALLQEAQHDPLTGVLNRKVAAIKIDKILSDFSQDNFSALFLLDIDNFKQINDRFGHQIGDRALQEMVCSLRQVCRKDDIIGRLGGDEFFLFLKDISALSVVIKKANQICHALKQKKFLESANSSFSCSIGISFAPFHGKTFDALYRCADNALYQSKANGKNQWRVFGYSGMPCISTGSQKE